MYFLQPYKTGSGNRIWCLFHYPRPKFYVVIVWVPLFHLNDFSKYFGELNNTKCQITLGWMTRNIHYLYWKTVLIQNKNLCRWMFFNWNKQAIWQNYEFTLPIRGKWITLKTTWFLVIHITRVYCWSQCSRNSAFTVIPQLFVHVRRL